MDSAGFILCKSKGIMYQTGIYKREIILNFSILELGIMCLVATVRRRTRAVYIISYIRL